MSTDRSKMPLDRKGEDLEGTQYAAFPEERDAPLARLECRHWAEGECGLGCPGDDPCPRSNGVVWPGGCLWYLQAEVLRARAEARTARERERKAVNEQVAQEVRRRATGEFRGALENAIDGLKDARESLVALEAKITKEKI